MEVAKNRIEFDREQLLADSKNERDQQQIIVFKIGNEEYGLNIDQIKEVVLTPNLTEVPEVNKYIKGVANVRGNIIAIIDLEERFGVTKKNKKELGKYILVVASEDLKLGVLVREMPNTLSILKSQIEEYETVMGNNGSDSQYIKGIVKMNDRLVLLIDVYKVVDNQEMGKLVQ